METLFPFGFPTSTAFYLALYVATFALHQACMHYVLAGSFYVAWATLFPGAGDTPRAAQPVASTLRDWMPFALSATITAGIAPLLFVQIVYQRNFYTANLLLSWRWMIVIPVLIVAFYLLYLVKGSILFRWPVAARGALVGVIAASFLFVGFCWTANHLISSQEADWPQIYETGNLHLSAAAVLLRMLVWMGGACGTLGVVARWQLAVQGPLDADLLAVEDRRLARLALAGLAVATLAAAIYLLISGQAVRGAVFGMLGLPYVLAAVAGVGAQGAAWALVLRERTDRWLLPLATAGCVLTVLATAVIREAVHLASLDITRLYAGHAAAATIDGLILFLVFAVVNTGIIVSCVWLVRSELAAAPAGASPVGETSG